MGVMNCIICAALIIFCTTESTKVHPRYPAYGCRGTFDQSVLIRLTRFDPKADMKVSNLILEEEIFVHC